MVSVSKSGIDAAATNTLKGAVFFRTDVHTGAADQPADASDAVSTTEPVQDQSQNTWSLAVEDTVRVASVDIVGGLSYDRYEISKAEDFSTVRGLFEYPKGGADAFNWQGALIWRYRAAAQVHASVSDRARFPLMFELYSTRFGTATPNPELGPERATNLEVGWKGRTGGVRLETTVFYSDVRNLIQTVLLADTTTQTQNVGDGRFYGLELAADVPVGAALTVGGNYTALSRTIHDALQPNLRPTGVPTHKSFIYAAWRPLARLTVTPSLEITGDRWSDVNTNPVQLFPYLRTGAYTLFDVAAQYSLRRNFRCRVRPEEPR